MSYGQAPETVRSQRLPSGGAARLGAWPDAGVPPPGPPGREREIAGGPGGPEVGLGESLE